MESLGLANNTHEEFGGYYKRHIKLHTILGDIENSGCWWYEPNIASTCFSILKIIRKLGFVIAVGILKY